MSSELKVDTISEKTTANGVTIDGVLVKDGAIASSYISGLSGGKILQVVSTLENTQEITTSTTYADLISASITPASASNKILIMYQDNVWINRSATALGGVIQIVAGASAISDSEIDLNYIDDGTSVNKSLVWSLNHTYLHSPSTTSAITYKIQWKASSGTAFYSSYQNQAKHLILMEVEG